MNKSVDCATAIYGIMAAGGAYVPLDPAAPVARLKYVIENCDIDILVTDARMAPKLSEVLVESPVKLIVGMMEEHEAIAQQDGAKYIGWQELCQRESCKYPALGLTENSLAYILFTSGSTGVPKGIMHSHRSGMCWAQTTVAAYQLSGSDRISNYAPLHFDLSTLDYFGSALAGATTVMIPEEYTRFPVSMAELIATEKLTIFYTVPYALLQLLSSGALELHRFPALRAILFGGEPMPPKHLQRIMALLPEVAFFNVYGPTETNGVTHYRVNAAALHSGEAIPIGEVYPNVEALVLDAAGEPVADGTEGELHICAGTIMRGYWRRPDLNQRVFWQRAQDMQRADYFVRTGDIVIRQQSGEFEFCGRQDRMVKTRGYRVELDDVEAAIVEYHAVKEGAVFIVPDPSGSVVIAAAVIPVEDETLQLQDLQRHLHQRLPPYAMPTNIEMMQDFPRTSSGKTDRVSLSKMAEAG